MRYSMVKSSLIAVLILGFTKMAAAQGLYEDYQSAVANYKAGSYVNSEKILEELNKLEIKSHIIGTVAEKQEKSILFK